MCALYTNPDGFLCFLSFSGFFGRKRKPTSCKRDSIVRTEVSIISKNYKKKGGALTQSRFQNGAGLPILLGFVFFFVLCFGNLGTIKPTVMCVAVAALLVIAVRFGTLRDRISLPFIALTLFVIMCGVSTFYAVSGKFALREFLKVLLAYLLAVILMATAPKAEESKGRRIALILAICAAIGSLISIDLISTRWISGVVLGFFGLFTDSFQDLTGVEAGIRMTSLFTNPNIYAGFAGIGVLLSLGLACNSVDGGKRAGCLVLLYVNSIGFILAFSMGASAFIALAFLVLFALTEKEKRADVLILMLETFILVLVAAALISLTSFGKWTGVRFIPLACAVLGSALLWLADRFIGQKLSARLSKHGKALVIAIAALILLGAAFLLAAWNMTGEATLAPKAKLRRAAYLPAGEYKLEVEAEGSLKVKIVSQNHQDTMMHTETKLFSGNVKKAKFTVPEDSLVVYFTFSSTKGAKIISASCGGEKIPLRYKLLPGFIANRLQGLFANANAIQRLVFFEDGIKLFSRRPVTGLGMGAFENAIKSTQSFYYETKYAHNHYIQTLLETGVIGLILFAALLVTSAIAVWKARRKHPFAPALGAALVFMGGHAATEVVFSSYAYLPMAFGVFAMISLCAADAPAPRTKENTVRTVFAALIPVCTVIYCIFIAGNMIALRTVKSSPSYESMEQGIRLDKFEWTDYALTYVVNAKNDLDDHEVQEHAEVYAARLAKVDSNSIPLYLADYYFTTNQTEQAIAMLEKYVDYVSSDATAWNDAFTMLRAHEEDSELFRIGVVRLAQKLEQWNAENMGDIQLNEASREFLAGYL